MMILGIESSCDETAAAVLEVSRGKINVISNVVSSQIKIHKKYGGVVPEVAARKHAEVIFDVIEKALRDSNASNYTRMPRKDANKMRGIDLIAVTEGPGLVTSLRVGVLAAQTIAALAKIPLVGVNHIEGHLLSAFLTPHLTSPRLRREERTVFPAVGLIVSGGHTELILVNDFGKYKMIGTTRDDAVGEAFDKVAKMLGLGYPGGPAIAAAAKSEIRNPKSEIKLPRPMINSDDFDFSFAGLKTATLYLTKKLPPGELKKLTPAIAAEFQQAAVEVLVSKTKRAAEKYSAQGGSASGGKIKNILVGGGVIANKELREALVKLDWPVCLPELKYTGDNAAMIAFAGYHKYLREKKNEVFNIVAEPNLALDKLSSF